MAYVVQGEDIETDDESSIARPISGVTPYEVCGEATESDDEELYTIATADSATRRHKVEADAVSTASILQRNLIDSNLSLVRTIRTQISRFLSSGVKQLASTEKLAIETLIAVQGTRAAINPSNKTTKELLEKLDLGLNGDFLPEIRMSGAAEC